MHVHRCLQWLVQVMELLLREGLLRGALQLLLHDL
jgi:hypothetical protein